MATLLPTTNKHTQWLCSSYKTSSNARGTLWRYRTTCKKIQRKHKEADKTLFVHETEIPVVKSYIHNIICWYKNREKGNTQGETMSRGGTYWNT